MSSFTCDVRGCPREAVHKIELEWSYVQFCCECLHGDPGAAVIPIGQQGKCSRQPATAR